MIIEYLKIKYVKTSSFNSKAKVVTKVMNYNLWYCDHRPTNINMFSVILSIFNGPTQSKKCKRIRLQ